MALRTYRGSCHCGAVQFEFDSEMTSVVRCNCSICSKKGALLHRVPPERFRLLDGADALRLYQFNTKTARHYFCGTCGIHPYSNPRLAPDHYTVNLRSVEGLDLDALAADVIQFDGRNFEQAAEAYQQALAARDDQ